MKTYITHSGPFHADDVLAWVITKMYKPCIQFYRTNNPTPEQLADPEIMVVDIGKQYDPALLNFDHHQDATLPAACSLVFDYFYSWLPREEEEKNNLVKAIIHRTLLDPVSDIDTGKTPNGGPAACLNATVKSCYVYVNNPDDSNDWDRVFWQAVQIVRPIWDAYILSARQEAEDAEKILAAQGHNPLILDMPDSKMISGWREYSQAMMIITQGSRGGYQVVSRDTNVLVLPESDKATFRHNSGFMVVFSDHWDALQYAMWIARNIKTITSFSEWKGTTPVSE